MKITKIVRQRDGKDRYSLFIDGSFTLSLSGNALLKSRLIVGSTLEDTDLVRLKQVAADDMLYGQALRYASLRLHSTHEMEQYIQRKGASPALTEKILNKLSEIKLLDDVAFSRAWVESKRLLRPTSKRKLQQELRAKGVADEVIDITLGGEQNDEQAALRELVAKKRSLPKYKADPMKLMQYLARQGFGYGDIKEALHEQNGDD